MMQRQTIANTISSTKTTPSPTTWQNPWPIRLFGKSVLKQRKYREICALLGATGGHTCLDIGADNGVISYLLRQRGGQWRSADLDAPSVQAIRDLVQDEVYCIDGEQTPFPSDTFDRIVIIDFLEHIAQDRQFCIELYRVMRADGELVVNVPHEKDSLLRRLRLAIGQTDEKHGHLRQGYTLESLRSVLGDEFTINEHRTYSKFFSELVDTIIVQAVYLLQRHKSTKSQKGAIVTDSDLQKHQTMFRVYAAIYPVVWLIAKLDALFFFRSGYMLIARAKVNKRKSHP